MVMVVVVRVGEKRKCVGAVSAMGRGTPVDALVAVSSGSIVSMVSAVIAVVVVVAGIIVVVVIIAVAVVAFAPAEKPTGKVDVGRSASQHTHTIESGSLSTRHWSQCQRDTLTGVDGDGATSIVGLVVVAVLVLAVATVG